MEDFRDYILSIGGSFPVPEVDFNTQLKAYSLTAEGAAHALRNYIGFSKGRNDKLYHLWPIVREVR